MDALSMSPDALATVRRLYRELDGFEIPKADARRVQRSRGSPTYGELMPTATARLLAQLELGPEDLFVDMGSGIGKVALLAAMTTDVGRALGIELSETRHAQAERALQRAREQDVPGTERVSFAQADMLTHPLDDATVVYTCSTAFLPGFMKRLVRRLASLPNLRKLATLQDLDPHPAFELVEIYRLDASWKRRTKVHVYERV
jgi:SAM-dependent methyltransferase